jgi:tetratricopeptide (TPR) repeat protein
VKAYAALKEAKLQEAEEDFKELTQTGKEGEVLGKEGLAVVYAKKGQADQALKLAQEVEAQDPQRSFVHVIKGDLLYAQDKKKEAEAEYQLALRKQKAEPYQEGLRYNQMGRYYASIGQFEKAREFYDRAITIDPYYIEGTTNKGITYEKEGKWDKALEAYRQTLALDKKDTFAVVLAKKAQEMLEIQKDTERKKRLDQLVKDLAARYRSQVEAKPKVEDTWTSPPMILSFVDFQEKGGLAERDGFSSVLLSQLTEHLNNSGRVRVVERVLIERLLEELNLGSSELANPETSLKLGRVLAAKLIGTGSLYYLPQGTLLNLRLIDTETSAIPQVLTRQLASQTTLEKDLFQLNREILKTVILKYPLRGYLAKVSGEEVIVNIGAKQGVVSGTKFDVLEEGESLTYRGKVLQAAPKVIGQIEIVRVEPDMAVGKIIKKEKPLQVDAKVQERIEEAALR